jgi:hypothetical protein
MEAPVKGEVTTMPSLAAKGSEARTAIKGKGTRGKATKMTTKIG